MNALPSPTCICAGQGRRLFRDLGFCAGGERLVEGFRTRHSRWRQTLCTLLQLCAQQRPGADWQASIQVSPNTVLDTLCAQQRSGVDWQASIQVGPTTALKTCVDTGTMQRPSAWPSRRDAAQTWTGCSKYKFWI